LAVTVHHNDNVDIPVESFAIPLGDRGAGTTIFLPTNEYSSGTWTFSFDIVLDERGCAVSAPIVNDQHTVDKVGDTPQNWDNLSLLVETRNNHGYGLALKQRVSFRQGYSIPASKRQTILACLY